MKAAPCLHLSQVRFLMQASLMSSTQVWDGRSTSSLPHLGHVMKGPWLCYCLAIGSHDQAMHLWQWLRDWEQQMCATFCRLCCPLCISAIAEIQKFVLASSSCIKGDTWLLLIVDSWLSNRVLSCHKCCAVLPACCWCLWHNGCVVINCIIIQALLFTASVVYFCTL